jgi:hypothetical protein
LSSRSTTGSNISGAYIAEKCWVYKIAYSHNILCNESLEYMNKDIKQHVYVASNANLILKIWIKIKQEKQIINIINFSPKSP